MGIQWTTDSATMPRRRSWRDELAADYEITQARLEVALEFSEDPEEYL